MNTYQEDLTEYKKYAKYFNTMFLTCAASAGTLASIITSDRQAIAQISLFLTVICMYFLISVNPIFIEIEQLKGLQKKAKLAFVKSQKKPMLILRNAFPYWVVMHLFYFAGF